MFILQRVLTIAEALDKVNIQTREGMTMRNVTIKTTGMNSFYVRMGEELVATVTECDAYRPKL